MQPADLAQLPDKGYMATGSAGPTKPVKLLAITAFSTTNRSRGPDTASLGKLQSREPESESRAGRMVILPTALL